MWFIRYVCFYLHFFLCVLFRYLFYIRSFIHFSPFLFLFYVHFFNLLLGFLFKLLVQHEERLKQENKFPDSFGIRSVWKKMYFSQNNRTDDANYFFFSIIIFIFFFIYLMFSHHFKWSFPFRTLFMSNETINYFEIICFQEKL